MSIVWLASYPKSGNTWLRAVLTSYMQEGGGPASINGLVGLAGNGRALFDEHVGLSSSDLTFSEVQRLRPLMYERLAAELPPPAFVKVHDACIRTRVGPVFPRNATAAAIYLVRNSLDVAPSYAAGGWREALTPAQVRSLVDAHAPVTKRFGYLDAAELFLRSARAGASRRSAVR